MKIRRVEEYFIFLHLVDDVKNVMAELRELNVICDDKKRKDVGAF